MANHTFIIRWICVFLVIVLTSCSSENGMQELTKIWAQLISCEDAFQEKEFVSKLHRSFKEMNGHYTIYATLQDGTEVDFIFKGQEIENPEKNIETVQVDFYQNNEHFIGADWKPKDINNIYILLLE